jgi:serine/threonine protein kinase/Flp pilus assembly protein TadD
MNQGMEDQESRSGRSCPADGISISQLPLGKLDLLIPNADCSAAALGQDDPRVIQALDDYLAALEAGRRPDRRVFLARHAEIAEALAKCLDGLEFVQQAAPQLDQQLADQGSALSIITGDLTAKVPLGDFRIIQEIGRGGMGVVYEAEQLSLGRRVALKVLPFAAALDAKQLQRFKNEAQAAAHLHHTNIVPVFGVGCERGVHFYAIQFIEGQTLAQIIADLRMQRTDGKDGVADVSTREAGDLKSALTRAVGAGATKLSLSPPFAPSAFFRTVAHLGLQVAEALEHAHQVGVVHRDIKPANLLLDRWGKLWITDFGLARFHTDIGLTLSGDLLGTLRYMSPEQAVGKWIPGDHRTDIYSLGTTLYELLTLRPAFDGSNREELLAQISTQEPRRARQVSSEVPAELETIACKAMEKKPEERYGSARDLADDLRRYLEDKPILAKPPTLALRARKWSRRHKPVIITTMVAAALALLLVIGGLVGAIFWVTQEKNRTQDALREAKANFETAEANRRRAEANFQRALDALDRMLAPLKAHELAGSPKLEPVRRKILEDALQYLENFKQEYSSDPAVRPEMAQAYARLASINAALGHSDQAEIAYRQALDLFGRLHSENPVTADFRNDLASCSAQLGEILRRNPGRYGDSESFFRQALIFWKDLISDFPGKASYREGQSETLHNLAYLLWTTDRIPEAEQTYQAALTGYVDLARDDPSTVKYRNYQGWVGNSIGVLQETTGRPRDAEESFRRALDLFDPKEEGVKAERNRSLIHLGLLLAQNGQFGEAEKAYRQLMRNAEEDAVRNPGDLALRYRHLASVLAITGRSAEALENIHKAIDLQNQLLTQSPTNAGYRNNLAISHHSLANLLRDTGRITQAEDSYLGAQKHQEQLTALFPRNADYLIELARTQSDWGNWLRASGRNDEAVEAFRRAAKGFQLALQLSPHRHDLNYHLARFLATCPDPQFRDSSRAVELAQKATGHAPQAWYCWRALGQARYRSGDWQASMTALEKSMEFFSGGNASDWFFLAMANWQLGDQPKARQWFDQAVKWMEKYQPKNEELGRFRAEAEVMVR